MKLFSVMVAAAITTSAFSTAFAQTKQLESTSTNVVPPPFTGANPLGENSPDWKVKVETSYLDSKGQLVTEEPVTFIVRDGFCTSDKERLVNIRPSGQVKVSQKICVGSVGKNKTTLVGLLFSSQDAQDGLTSKAKSDAHYGKEVGITFEGSTVVGEFGDFRVTVQKVDS